MCFRGKFKNKIIKFKPQIVLIPENLQIIYIGSAIKFYVENLETKVNSLFDKPYFINFINNQTNYEFYIDNEFIEYKISKSMLYTFTSKFKNSLRGISKLYTGSINLQGLGFSVTITKLETSEYNLFFRFGFKDKCNYIMPTTVRIDNADSAKTRILLSCKSMELLKKVQIQIRNLRKPSAFKLQGIYLDDIFPKVKKFVK
jgi:ribosomal protein L6P/L9E